MTSRTAFVVTYDATAEANDRTEKLKFWLKSIALRQPTAPVVVVVTRVDEVEDQSKLDNVIQSAATISKKYGNVKSVVSVCCTSDLSMEMLRYGFTAMSAITNTNVGLRSRMPVLAIHRSKRSTLTVLAYWKLLY